MSPVNSMFVCIKKKEIIKIKKIIGKSVFKMADILKGPHGNLSKYKLKIIKKKKIIGKSVFKMADIDNR